MKRLSAASTVLVCLLLLLVVSMVLATFSPIVEMFGSQGGEMDQLEANEVPLEDEDEEYQKERKNELRDMTDLE